MRCIHCLIETEKITDDHVFPKSWYPDSTPDQVQRWKAPSCVKCNGKLGDAERWLFSRLALTTDPAKMEVSGLAEKALRSYGVRAQVNEQEARIREKLRRQILKEMSEYSGPKRLLPGDHSQIPAENSNLPPPIPIDGNKVRMVYEKIIRGCEYVLNNGRYIEAPYLLEVWDDKVSGTFDGIFNAAKPVATLGPGFVVRRGFAAEDLLSVMYKINFWGKYDILASIAVP